MKQCSFRKGKCNNDDLKDVQYSFQQAQVRNAYSERVMLLATLAASNVFISPRCPTLGFLMIDRSDATRAEF